MRGRHQSVTRLPQSSYVNVLRKQWDGAHARLLIVPLGNLSHPKLLSDKQNLLLVYDDVDAYTLLLHGLSPSFCSHVLSARRKILEALHALLYLSVAFIHSACLLFMASKDFIGKYFYESLLPHVKSPGSFVHIRYLSSFFTMSIILPRPCAFKSLPGNVNMSQLLTSYCFGLSLHLLSLRIVNFQCRLSFAPSVPHM